MISFYKLRCVWLLLRNETLHGVLFAYMSQHLKPAAHGKGRVTVPKHKSTSALTTIFTAECRNEIRIKGAWLGPTDQVDFVLTAPPEERANQIAPFPKPTVSTKKSARNPRGLQLCPSDVNPIEWTCIVPSLEVCRDEPWCTMPRVFHNQIPKSNVFTSTITAGKSSFHSHSRKILA